MMFVMCQRFYICDFFLFFYYNFMRWICLFLFYNLFKLYIYEVVKFEFDFRFLDFKVQVFLIFFQDFWVFFYLSNRIKIYQNYDDDDDDVFLFFDSLNILI